MPTARSPIHDEDVYRYLLEVSSRETEVMARLRAATAPRPEAEMQIGPDQGQLLALLVRLIGARRCIEIGTLPSSTQTSRTISPTSRSC